MNVTKWILPLSLTVLLSACTHPIEQPIASRPLVETVIQRDQNVIPKDYWGLLSDGASGEQFRVLNYDITLLNLYNSASGKICRRFEVGELSSLGSPEVRNACKYNGNEGWYLSAPTVSNLISDIKLSD